MKSLKHLFYCIIALFFAVSCSDSNGNIEPVDTSEKGVFIINEGNFGYGNASLSFYQPDEKSVENEIFSRSNNYSLGDVAQSMSIYNNKAYVVVNNSGVVFVIDTKTFKTLGRIANLTSPRYIHFISSTKAYVTDLYSGEICIFNPQTYEKTGSISTEKHKSTEQMVQYGKYVFTNCWSYDNKILVIDSQNDKIVDSITVGIQPRSMVIDKHNKIWVITDGGGYPSNPIGYEAPTLYRIDAATRTIENTMPFDLNDYVPKITINGAGDGLFFVCNGNVYNMSVESTALPTQPAIAIGNTMIYSLAIHPKTSEIYVADAIDYMQKGKIYRYSPTYSLIDVFSVGIIPGEFCFSE